MFYRYSMLYKEEEKLLSSLSVTNNHMATQWYYGIQTNFAYHSFQESITKNSMKNRRTGLRGLRTLIYASEDSN